MPQLDILYMTRVQKERFFNEADYIRLKDTPCAGPGEAGACQGRPDHPAPPCPVSMRSPSPWTRTPRACYWKQVKNGKFIPDGPDYEAAGRPGVRKGDPDL